MTNITYTEHQLSKEDIDSKVRQLINELYDCCYTENLVIDKLYPLGYKVSITLLCNETPFVVAIEAEGDKFFKYLKKALQESALGSAEFFTISSSKRCPTPINPNIKGNYDNSHRVQQDNITYTVENNNN